MDIRYNIKEITITIPIIDESKKWEGSLKITENSKGLVSFVHGSGSERHSPRNQNIAKFLNEAGLNFTSRSSYWRGRKNWYVNHGV